MPPAVCGPEAAGLLLGQVLSVSADEEVPAGAPGQGQQGTPGLLLEKKDRRCRRMTEGRGVVQSTEKNDDASRGFFRHASDAWPVRFICGAGHIDQENPGSDKASPLGTYDSRATTTHGKPSCRPAAERRRPWATVIVRPTRHPLGPRAGYCPY